MNEVDMGVKAAQLDKKASRAQRILYVAMSVFILLPFIVVWLTGAIRF